MTLAHSPRRSTAPDAAGAPDGVLLSQVAGAIAAHAAPDAFVPAALACVAAVTGACRVALVAGEGASEHVRWSVGDGDAVGTHVPTVVQYGSPPGTDRTFSLVLWEPTALVAEVDLRAVVALVAAVVGPTDRATSLTDELEANTRAAAAERDFAAAVIDALPVGVYVTDQEHRVRLWNRKREVDTLGVARESAIGRTVFDVLPRQDATLVRRELDDVLASGVIQQFDTESTSSGEARIYRLSKIPMALGGDAPSHVITVGEDVTEWRAALERSAQSEKLAAVGQLAAGVMHEINNPLGTIAACAETMTLALTELPPEQQPAGFTEYLRIVDHEVHRCRRIVDGLLNFSRARELRRARVSLDSVVEGTLGLLRHHARFKRCAVTLELGAGAGTSAPPEVLGDPDQLTQIAMALLLNAADATASAAQQDEHADVERTVRRGITIRTHAAIENGAPVAVLEIADDGTGMSREVQARIFDPFYTTKAPGDGTGLGLAICYGLVRDLHGRIDVESAPGQGATFRVIIPAA